MADLIVPSININDKWSYPFSQERARRYKTVGSTATAFVSAEEQKQDTEPWRIEQWVIDFAMMVDPVSLSILWGIALKPVSEDLKDILYKVTAKDAIKLFLDIDNSRKMVRIWSSHKKWVRWLEGGVQSTVGKKAVAIALIKAN